jgi:hypothetical protein
VRKGATPAKSYRDSEIEGASLAYFPGSAPALDASP